MSVEGKNNMDRSFLDMVAGTVEIASSRPVMSRGGVVGYEDGVANTPGMVQGPSGPARK